MGEYDYNMDLVSISQESLEWGRELFRYYQNRSKKIDSEVLSLL
jgi:predicted transcriptional regulator